MGEDVKKTDTKLQTFEVQIPHGVRPGQSFALMAGGQRVLVNCPMSAVPGKFHNRFDCIFNSYVCLKHKYLSRSKDSFQAAYFTERTSCANEVLERT